MEKCGVMVRAASGPGVLHELTGVIARRGGDIASVDISEHTAGEASVYFEVDLPDDPEPLKREYDLATIRKWLEVFCFRFFQISQFKRSAMPNGPKVGSGGSLSPRGDWRAPSDSESVVWLEELKANVPD